MSSGMNLEFEFLDNETIIYLAGDIDSSIESLMKLAKKKVQHSRLTLDCGNIGHIRGDGIVPWMNGLEFLKEGLEVKLDRCTQVFVDLSKMIPQFTRSLGIRSFYSSVVCLHCDSEQTLLIELIDDHPIMTNEESCKKCGQLFPLVLP